MARAAAGPSNADILGRPSAVWALKKKARKEQLAEVVFDDEARREFLTGFHKRKVQKKEAKVAHAREREKLERLAERADHRRELRDRARKNFEAVEKALGGTGEIDPSSILAPDHHTNTPPAEEEETFSDAEQFATVTLIDDFDPLQARHAPTPPPSSPRSTIPVDRPPPPPPLKPKVKPKGKSGKGRNEGKAGRKTAKGKERVRGGRREREREREGGRERGGKSGERGKKGRRR